MTEMISTNKRWIIFDFDGTLADTVTAGLAVINSFASKYGFKPVAGEDLPVLRNKASKEILKAVGLSVWKLPFLARDVRKKFYEQVPALQMYPGIPQALEELKRNGFFLAILTTNSEENVRLFLADHQLKLFDFVHSEKNLFGKGKVLQHLLKDHVVNPGEAAYVGDETRDIEAAKNAGVVSAAVTWGVNSREILSAQRPDFIADEPKQLSDWLIQKFIH